MKTIFNYFSDFIAMLPTIKITDIIDILVVAFLIYTLMMQIRSSATSRIAKSIVMLLLLTWLTGVLSLHALNFILDEILQVGLIALLIVFQPELRRALEKVGGKSIFGMIEPRGQVHEIDRVISQTVSACETMSREKIGVLLAFERSTSLAEYEKTGTVVDARLSAELLRNIFFPKASLHDGAVIVRNGRVAAAGCVLPLSKNEHLNSDLGTRHRAGIGISEVSDAIVVIVSEETGTISVAVGGMLKRHLAPQMLEHLLRNELAPLGEKKENRLTRLYNRVMKKGDK